MSLSTSNTQQITETKELGRYAALGVHRGWGGHRVSLSARPQALQSGPFLLPPFKLLKRVPRGRVRNTQYILLYLRHRQQ